jgi:hypothetical protein
MQLQRVLRYGYIRNTIFISQFLGVFAKLQKAITSFIMSLHPSTHLSAWKNSAITGQIFINFDI